MMEIDIGSKEITSFRRKGYLLIRGAVEEERCDALRAVGEVHLRYRIEPFETEEEHLGRLVPRNEGRIRRLRQIYDRDVLFRRWMEEPAIRPLLSQLLGTTPVLVTAHHNSMMTKMPDPDTETRWHRDRRYWHYRDNRLLSVWLALGEENIRNGVLEFIPGSHREEFPTEAFDEREYFREDLRKNRSLIAKRERFRLHKGDLILFHCELLHRAGPNLSDHPKLSLVYTVKASDNEALPGTRSSAYPEIPLPIQE